MYKELLTKTYQEVIDILNDKYGSVKGDYFCNESCKSKNSKISRTSEGLVMHHIREDIIPLLSDSNVAKNSLYDYQKANNLVYCNYIEHLILHIIICLNTKLSLPGISIIYRDINCLYQRRNNNCGWKLNCYKAIENGYEEYIDILKNIVGELTNNSIEELSEVDFNKSINKKIYNDLSQLFYEEQIMQEEMERDAVYDELRRQSWNFDYGDARY